MVQRRSLLLIGLSWHTAVLKQYPYCCDISIKVEKRGLFGSDLLAILNGPNRADIMHHFMVNQIPREQRNGKSVDRCDRVLFNCLIFNNLDTLYLSQSSLCRVLFISYNSMLNLRYIFITCRTL